MLSFRTSVLQGREHVSKQTQKENTEMAKTVIGENELIAYTQMEKFSNSAREEFALLKAVPDPRADMAKDLIRAWGLVAGKRGEDTAAGRPTLEHMSCEEVVDRAFTMTELAWAEMDKRGWLVKINRPSDDLDTESKP